MHDWEYLLPPSDREVLRRVDVQREEALEAHEWTAAGVEGWVDDDIAFFSSFWGFSSSAISAPTLLVYGQADALVPPSHGRAWARAIPHAELRVIPGGGHWLRDFEGDYLRWLASSS
jgi:pimeloyl-ACP methyl ester carboxylesterase